MLQRYLSAGAILMMVACGGSSTPGGPSTSSATRIIGLVGNLSFGNVQVGNTSVATLSITNSGNSPLTVTGITVSTGLGGVFTSTFTSGTIAAGGSQQVTIRFTPAVAQNYVGTLNVAGDQTSGTSSIAISGAGVLPRANIQGSATGTYVCFTGLCTSFTYQINNVGPGCATNVQVITRFFGSDGSGPQLGIDVPMGQVGGSLSATFFRVGTMVTVQNLIPFNDIRSAHTVFRPSITWADAACP